MGDADGVADTEVVAYAYAGIVVLVVLAFVALHCCWTGECELYRFNIRHAEEEQAEQEEEEEGGVDIRTVFPTI